MIIEVAQGSSLEQGLREGPIGARPEVVIVGLAPDPDGRLAAPEPGHVVASVPSPQALAVEPDAITRAIEGAGGGSEPLIVLVQEAEALLEEQVAPVIEASVHAPRSVILRYPRCLALPMCLPADGARR